MTTIEARNNAAWLSSGRWTYMIQLEPGGHRLFFEAESSSWAIADRSGPTPESTDDGVLWLDFSRPLEVELSRGSVVSVPVKSAARRVWCLAGLRAFAVLRDLFPSWEVNMDQEAREFVTVLAPLIGGQP